MIEFKTLLATLFVAAWICGGMTYSLVVIVGRGSADGSVCIVQMA